MLLYWASRAMASVHWLIESIRVADGDGLFALRGVAVTGVETGLVVVEPNPGCFLESSRAAIALVVGVDFQEEAGQGVSGLVHDLLEEGSLPQELHLGGLGIGQGTTEADRHLEGEADLPGLEVVVVSGDGVQTCLPLHELDDRVEGLQARAGHDGLSGVEVVAQAVELVEQVEVELREQQVSGQEKVQLGDSHQELGLHDIGLEGDHLGQAGVPVRVETGVGRLGDGHDAAAIGRRQAQDIAELTFGVEEVGGRGHEVQPGLFDLHLSVGQVAAAATFATDFLVGHDVFEQGLRKVEGGTC